VNDDVVVITSQEVAEPVSAQAESVKLLIESMGRNTAAAVATAAIYAQEQYGKAMLWVCPADHYIEDEESLLEEVKGIEDKRQFTLFGMEPKEPSSDYGYILAEGGKVTRFVEKPVQEEAKALIGQGAKWNSGMFMFSTSTLREAMQEFEREMWTQCERALKAGVRNAQGVWLDAAAYDVITPKPIDKAIMEKADNLHMIPLSIGWSDVGTEEQLERLLEEGCLRLPG
jgi:mannose-1-phosphate guanylyltransferase